MARCMVAVIIRSLLDWPAITYFSIDAGQMDQNFMLIIANDAPRIARIRIAAFKIAIIGTPASRPEVVNFGTHPVGPAALAWSRC